MSRPWQTLGSAPTPEGLLELRQRGDRDFLIVVAGRVLMTSTARRSEEALSELGLAHLKGRAGSRVLIGGLGMGYTLRAALDQLPASARVTVAELHPIIADWCRGPLAHLTDSAVLDPRVRIEIGDVAGVIRDAASASLDAILLDLYEGPYVGTQRREDPHFGPAALGRARSALAAGGMLAIWGEDLDPPFVARLRKSGFTVEVGRSGRGGRSHVLYLARRD
jgi:spermidine synthase